MTSNKEAQAARSAADRILREENKVRYAELMQAEYDKRDLGEYKPKTTAEERAERKAAAEQAKAEAKVREWAERGGLSVTILGKEEEGTTSPSPEGEDTSEAEDAEQVVEDEPEWARG